MNYISELRDILGQQLGWHKSRLDCFATMLLALRKKVVYAVVHHGVKKTVSAKLFSNISNVAR